MKINNIDIIGNKVAYDDCHKIYIIEDEEDLQEAKKIGYSIYDIKDIVDIYENSCPLVFISNWKLNKHYVKQFESAKFEINGKIYKVNNDKDIL